MGWGGDVGQLVGVGSCVYGSAVGDQSHRKWKKLMDSIEHAHNLLIFHRTNVGERMFEG